MDVTDETGKKGFSSVRYFFSSTSARSRSHKSAHITLDGHEKMSEKKPACDFTFHLSKRSYGQICTLVPTRVDVRIRIES